MYADRLACAVQVLYSTGFSGVLLHTNEQTPCSATATDIRRHSAVSTVYHLQLAGLLQAKIVLQTCAVAPWHSAYNQEQKQPPGASCCHFCFLGRGTAAALAPFSQQCSRHATPAKFLGERANQLFHSLHWRQRLELLTNERGPDGHAKGAERGCK